MQNTKIVGIGHGIDLEMMLGTLISIFFGISDSQLGLYVLLLQLKGTNTFKASDE